MRVAFFYPWFNKDRWANEPPHTEPLLGRYDSLDPDVLRLQMALLRYARVKAIAVSWWGPQDNEAFVQVYDAAFSAGIQVCPHVEIDVDGNPDYRSAVTKIPLHDALFRPTLRYAGAPVVFAYKTWAVAGDGDPNRVAKLARLPGYHVVAQRPGADSQYRYDPAQLYTFVPGQCFGVSAGFHHSKETAPRLERDIERFRGAVRWMDATERVGWPWQLVYWNEWAEGTQVEPDVPDGLDYVKALRGE